MIKSLQGEGEANEVEIGVEGSVDDYARYAEGLLKVVDFVLTTLPRSDTKWNCRMRRCYSSHYGRRLLRRCRKSCKWSSKPNVCVIKLVRISVTFQDLALLTLNEYRPSG